jgi:hypothetical protein
MFVFCAVVRFKSTKKSSLEDLYPEEFPVGDGSSSLLEDRIVALREQLLDEELEVRIALECARLLKRREEVLPLAVQGYQLAAQALAEEEEPDDLVHERLVVVGEEVRDELERHALRAQACLLEELACRLFRDTFAELELPAGDADVVAEGLLLATVQKQSSVRILAQDEAADDRPFLALDSHAVEARDEAHAFRCQAVFLVTLLDEAFVDELLEMVVEEVRRAELLVPQLVVALLLAVEQALDDGLLHVAFHRGTERAASLYVRISRAVERKKVCAPEVL